MNPSRFFAVVFVPSVPDEKFDFDKQLEGYDYPSFSDLDNIDTDFEKDLSFSNYDFEKKDKK